MKKISREKYLIKNTAIFAFGNISTKFIHFFLVPFYTYALNTAQYGTIDLINSISSMLIPIIMCSIGEAVRRYLLDSDSDSAKIKAVEFLWIIIGFVGSLFLYCVLRLIPAFREYAIMMSAYTFTNALFQTTQDYLRGCEKLKLYTLCSIFSSLGIAVLNILFLTRFRMGIKGYFLSYIIAYLLSSVIAFICGKQYHQLKEIRFDKDLFKEMSTFSITLVPNSILWWVINSSDRIMVTNLVSAAANGIYSVSYKFPSLMSTFNTILMQAWQHSAIRESESEDKDQYTNRMFRLYFAISAIIAAVLLQVLKPFMRLYVAPGYYSAWQYSPFLIVGMMFQTLGTFVGTSYYVEKDMKGNLFSTAVGAVANVILNLCLIPVLKANGAAIATCVSYIIILIYRLIDTKKYVKIHAVTPYTVGLSLTVLAMLGFVYLSGWVSYLLMAICVLIVLIITRDVYIVILRIFFGHSKKNTTQEEEK